MDILNPEIFRSAETFKAISLDNFEQIDSADYIDEELLSELANLNGEDEKI